MRTKIRVTALVSLAGLTLTGCATAASTQQEVGTGSGDQQCENTKLDGEVKVAIAFDVGGRGDQSYNDAAYTGLQRSIEEHGFESTTGQASAEESESVREQRLRGFVDEGYNVILSVGWAYDAVVDKVSEDFPNVAFAVIDGSDPTPEDENCNVAYLSFAENEGSFLAGVAAAEMTETGSVGYVGGVNNTLIQRFEAGYRDGVAAVDPDIKILSTYLEETDPAGFADPAGGQAAASGLISEGADVVFHAAGASGSGVFDAAASAGVWAIGVDTDQYLTASPQQQDHILTSMIKRVDVATEEFIESAINAEPLVGDIQFALADGGVDYATSGDFLSGDIIAVIDEYKQQIIDGEVEVATQP